MVDYSIYIPKAPDILGTASTMAGQVYNNQLRDARAQRLYEQMDLDRQKAEIAQAKAAQAAANTAASKAAVNAAIQNSVLPANGEAPGPYMPDVNRAVNTLALQGRIPEANTLSNFLEQQAKQRSQEGTAAENAAKAKGEDLKNLNTRITYYRNLSQFVDTPEKAAAFSQAMIADPAMADYAHIAGDPQQAAAKNAELYNKDPIAWHTAIANLSGEQFLQAKLAKPTQVSAGATLIDTNPQSPTYGQTIAQGAPTNTNIKPPAGYRWNADNTALEVIPGGPAEAKAAAGKGTELTPDALDVAAHSYILSGILPPGMGKNATEIRTQIMNRATELANGRSAEEFASDMRANKNDTAAMAKAVKDFGTGTQGKMVNSFNTAIDHLETTNTLIDALANNDTKKINSIGNAIAAEFGVAAPTNFDAAKNVVANEIVKAINASGGALADRQEAEKALDRASSPEQLKGVVDTYQKLLGGQLKSLRLQYGNMTGKSDFDKKLTDNAKAAMTRLSGGGAAGNGVDTSNPLLQ